MSKKIGIFAKIFKTKKKESNCCSFDIEEVQEGTELDAKASNCCTSETKESKCCSNK